MSLTHYTVNLNRGVMEDMKGAIRLTAVFFALSALASPEAFAQPSVTTLSGTIASGQALTIIGAGFGAKTQVQPVSWDDFDGGTNSSTLGAPVIGDTWTFHNLATSSPVSASYSNALLRTNSSLSAKCSMSASNGQSVCSFGWTGHSHSQLYFTYWRYNTPSGTVTRNHKQFYVFGNSSSDLPQVLLASIPCADPTWQVYDNQDENEYNTAGWTFDNTNDLWQRGEGLVKLNEPYTSSNGVFQVWKDGVLGVDVSTMKIRDTDNLFDDFRLGNMHAHDALGQCAAGGDNVVYFDDLYIDTTPQRVEISDSPTWASSTHREIQLLTSWSDTSVTVTLRNGAFSTLNNLYLYVVDANGDANSEGHLLCTGCPAAPTSVVEQ
ncbi:MAG: hypothetical protein A2X93_04175 [Deltaproteobacteria bacterium GWC2_56_8]|nr:MAG: hypothetical protein A2X93_04175 [Deltaproteobacteria bacterium GWC2_56_8]